MPEKMKDCEPSTTAGYTLEKHLPVGFLWLAFRTVGTLLYKIWGGFARAYDSMTNDLCRMEKELNPYQTKDLLPEWETSFGLPDTCLPGRVDFDTRKAAMIERFEGKRWVTIEDWRELAVLAGVTATITPGDELLCDQGFPYKFPIVFGGQKKGGRYLIYIEVKECQRQGGFPYKFPIVFGETGEKCALFKCLIKSITPAFVVVVWDKPPTCDPVLKWFEKGIFAKAAFVLDFTTKKAAHYSNEMLLGELLSSARTTNGYGERLDGSLQLFATNVPRITDKGLLVEPQRTNLLKYSDNIFSAGWQNSNMVANNLIDTSPDGSNVRGVTLGDGYIYQDYTVLAGDITHSVYIKSSKVSQIGLRLPGAGSADPAHVLNLTTDWQRYEVNTTTNSSSRFLLENRTAHGFGTDILDLFIWGAQVEPGLTASPLINTQDATAIRDADNISIALADGTYNITFTFDDDSTKIINNAVVTGRSYAVPHNLSRAYIKSITGELV